ncbi:MAG: DUF4382 domain-containing protein [gamma proteobacterium endosymbiont of Lamellibrachia anaximandri]|nr:DUF4382 domain-containing protein [gamma proteobacterium endosymbiont of Lamellibrachia anaximandri]MBL3533004.1 DUF4382 domain-containing protein [gamma proteobacterium endosymbiont of Lamellibrachia anaximandri]
MYKRIALPSLSFSLMLLLLAGCGGGDTGTTTASRLDLGITDAPVDGADAVWVEFSEVVIQPADGARINILMEDVNGNPTPKSINLLDLQGGVRDMLLDGYELPAGQYSWIRLMVNAEADGVLDSYIELPGPLQYELQVPSGSQTGLKINTGFEILEGDTNDYTIDFDLRKSVHQPNGQVGPLGPVYFLRPTLRLMKTATTGTISGTVDPVVFAGEACDGNTVGYAVYVFSGTGATPVDVNVNDQARNNPVTTAAISDDGNFTYTAAYLSEGTYTVAATCAADLDDPELDNQPGNQEANPEVTFVGTADVNVTAGAETLHDIL